ncbi:MAG: excinuclease subunit [Actinomycetota bacterium]|nr:excinuclease subunit [Actinomycetota bacterium]
MADPATYRPAAGSIPESPGVYRFTDNQGRVVYVGKAKSLRSRLNSYFTDVDALHPRTQGMLATASRVEWTVVATEVEALQLEYNWIKEFDPRFNVKYRDDKSYPYLAVITGDEVPRSMVYRGPKRKGVRYFGPYAHAWAIRETLDLLLRVFPMRTCSNGVYRRAERTGQPCLLGHIGKCSAPCVGWVSLEEHRGIVDDFCEFMAGHTGDYLKRLEREMREAAAEQEYERAARLRDDAEALKRAMEKQTVVLSEDTDADVVALSEDQLEAAVQVFFVRGGRVRGQRGWVVEKVEDVTTADLVEHFVTQLYGDADNLGGAAGDVPREVLVPVLPSDADAITEWLCERRGTRVDLRVPQRGDKRALMETVARNAAQALVLHKTKRAGDLTARGRALQEIQDALDLDQAPLRIECYDISNLQGADVVASMVVFEDGLARKSEYRRFAMNTVGTAALPVDVHPHADPSWRPEGGDQQTDRATANDVAAIHEVITRRFRRYLDERAASELQMDEPAADEIDGLTAARMDGLLPLDGEGGRTPQIALAIDPVTGKPRKFAYAPNLIVVDGGPPQVAAAQRALHELGIDDIALVGLAKRLEEVWRPGDPEPVILPRSSEGLYLLQRVRDEAHRFAISYHRSKRSKSMTRSALEGIPGLGETRRKALLRHFGSVKQVRAATVDELAAVPGVGRQTAEAVHATLAGGGPTAASTTKGTT